MEHYLIDRTQYPDADLLLRFLSGITTGRLEWTEQVLSARTDDPHIAALLERMSIHPAEEPATAPAAAAPTLKKSDKGQRVCAQCGAPLLGRGPQKLCAQCKTPAAKPEPKPEPADLQPEHNSQNGKPHTAIWRDIETLKEYNDLDLRWAVTAGRFPAGRRFEHLITHRIWEARLKQEPLEPGEKPSFALAEVLD